MLLSIFLAIVICAAVTLMMFAAVAFIQDKKMFSSAPKEFRDVIKPREKELFYGARTIGWILMGLSLLMIVGSFLIAIWDGLRCEYSFWQFFMRFSLLFTIYKAYDMIFFDYFLLLKFHFFQFYFPEIESVSRGRTYGFNLKSQLLKLLIVFPAISALLAWVLGQLA